MAAPVTERRPVTSGPHLDNVHGDPTAVAAFLAQHPFLSPLLNDARDRLAAVFGQDVSLVLDVSTDPEEGDTALFARVQTALSPDDALDRLDEFFDIWWLRTLPAARGLLHFDFA